MRISGAGEPSEISARWAIPDSSKPDTSTKTKMNFMTIAIVSSLAMALVITVAGINYVEKIQAAVIRDQDVLQDLLEIKASALSTIMLDPASPPTVAVFADAGRKIQDNSRSALGNIVREGMNRDLEGILAQWREYERESSRLIRLSADDPRSALKGVDALYKEKFIPFQRNLESYIANWSAMTDTEESRAAETTRMVKWSVSFLILTIAGTIVTMLLIVTRSINANIRSKEESYRLLRQSEALLNVTQGMAKIGGWEYDVEKQTMFWTDEVYNIHDIAKEDVPPGSVEHISKSLECYAPESRPAVLGAFQKCAAEGVPYDMELSFTSTKGRRMWIRTSGKPVLDDGKIVGVIGDIMDVTALKKVEEELQRFFNLVPDMVCVASTDGYFLKINPAWEKTLGYSERELVATPFLNHIHPDDREPTLKEVARQIGGEATIEFTNRYRCKDGGYKWLEWMALPSPDKKQLIAAARDVTERKAAEEKLRAAKEEAETANNLKDKFVSLVTHDLKSPLATISGYLQLMRSDSKNIANGNYKEFLDRSISTTEDMALLIQNILNISRFRTGGIKSQKGFFDASLIGRKMSADYQYMAQSKGITLENAIPDHTSIYSDRTLLTEAVQNFVTNAIKFCGKGNRITISIETGADVTIFVSDDGPGMDADTKRKLLNNEGYRSKTGTAGERGTGYGLMMTKEVLEALGGKLLVESEPGKGSRFGARIPTVRPKILLVGDDRSFSALVAKGLKNSGPEIVEAEDGQKAAGNLGDGRELPHLILLDVEKTGGKGLDLLSFLQKRPETQNIPVMVVSGSQEAGIRDAAFKLGARDFLSKQSDGDDFISRVKRFIC